MSVSSQPTERRSSRRASIDPDRLLPMHKIEPQPGPDFNVMIIGAGNINFGSDEGPWNHSQRLERKWGTRLKVVALVDPSTARANLELDKKRKSFVAPAYQDTAHYKTIQEAVERMDEDEKPHAIIIGAPAQFRGGTQPGRDLELQLLEHFPGSALFVEKPVATGPKEETIAEAKEVGRRIAQAGTITSVGYMLRYSKAVQTMKRILEDNELEVMATTAQYICAYEKIAKEDWWDKARTLGPIIEQATHFADLSRYFGGDVDLASVQASALEWNEKPGKLRKVPIDEGKIPPEQRIPRATSATWKYESGAVGSLTHAVALQGTDYYTTLTVYADGYQLRLVDPYNDPHLYVRRPGSDSEEIHRFHDDDPFFSEISNFGDLIESTASSRDAIGVSEEDTKILSSYEDAVKTYEFTWAIRDASERSRKKPAQE